MRQTTEQIRAKLAWEQVESLGNSDIEEFSTLSDGAASFIQKVGFGQALAFWLAKGGVKIKLTNYLAERLMDDDQKKGRDLMKYLTEVPSDQYRQLTNEAIVYLNWIKRFAKGRKKELGK